MNVHAGREDDRTLRRIMALLVTFAALAERCAARSLPVRLLVMWALRRAEAVATDYVFEASGTPLPAIAGIVATGNDPADALLLAARFRMLAAVLGTLLPVACPSGRRRVRRGSASGQIVPGLGGWMEPNDTS